MDIGSLGDVPIAAHGRADALAVMLSAAGRELVFDPGTASYYRKPPWRSMDRGAGAHPMEAPTRPEWVGPRARTHAYRWGEAARMKILATGAAGSHPLAASESGRVGR
jgi:Heparinase II/III-like protein